MKVLVRPNRAGKTYESIKLAHENDYYIVTYSASEATRIYHEAIKLGMLINFPLTPIEFFDGMYSAQDIKGFIIDSLDEIVRRASKVPIAMVTLTDEPDEEPHNKYLEDQK